MAGDAAQIVEPDDVQGLAEAMQRYLDDPASATGATERGLRRSRQYSWDASAKTLLTAYARILTNGRRE